MIWASNEDGFWCDSCGNRVAPADEPEESLPDECGQCGFPDAEQVARYHCGDDFESDLDGDEEEEFDCARFWIKGEGWFCPKQGSEECDWDCPHS